MISKIEEDVKEARGSEPWEKRRACGSGCALVEVKSESEW